MTLCPLAELQEQFQQLQYQLAHLEPATHPPAQTAELMQLRDKLQHLTMTLQPHPAPKPKEEPMHITMQTYTDTLHATLREVNLTTSLLQDIPTFDGQDFSKLEDWLMDVETTADI